MQAKIATAIRATRMVDIRSLGPFVNTATFEITPGVSSGDKRRAIVFDGSATPDP